MVPAAQEYFGRLVGHRLKQREICRQSQTLRFKGTQPDVAGQMTHRAGHEERRLAQGDDAVGEHVPALAVDQCNRQALLEILAPHHLLTAILCEEIRPSLKLPPLQSSPST